MTMDRIISIVSIAACLLVLAQDAISRTNADVRADRHARESRLEACHAQCARVCK